MFANGINSNSVFRPSFKQNRTTEIVANINIEINNSRHGIQNKTIYIRVNIIWTTDPLLRTVTYFSKFSFRRTIVSTFRRCVFETLVLISHYFVQYTKLIVSYTLYTASFIHMRAGHPFKMSFTKTTFLTYVTCHTSIYVNFICWKSSCSVLLAEFRGGVIGLADFILLYWYLAFLSEGLRIWKQEVNIVNMIYMTLFAHK